MLDHDGRKAVPVPLHAPDALGRRRESQRRYVALIGRKNPLSSTRSDG